MRLQQCKKNTCTHSICIHTQHQLLYSNSTCQQHTASTYTTPAPTATAHVNNMQHLHTQHQPLQQQHMSTMARTLNNGTCSICIHTTQYTTPSPRAHLNKTRSFCMHSTSTHSNSTQNYNTQTPTDSTATPEATSFKATTLVTALITLYHKIKT